MKENQNIPLGLLLDGRIGEEYFLIEKMNDRLRYLLSKGLPTVIIAVLLSIPVSSVEAAGVSHNDGKRDSVTQFAEKSLPSDVETVAKTLYHEARGEGFEGMQAVASVIWNRANGDTNRLDNVCLVRNNKTKYHAFSCWNAGSLSKGSGQSWEWAVKIAKAMKSAEFRPSHKYKNYYNPAKANPSWAYGSNSKLLPHTNIGAHRFMTAK